MFWILKLIVLILLMAIMHPAFTQTTLRGVIVHKDQPAAGATISFGKRNAVSDSAGRFSFSSLAAGKHLLHITMTGFEPIHQYISIVENETRKIPFVEHTGAVLESNICEQVLILVVWP